jgi:hypothetical protein
VWAIDEDHALHYYFPRDCPRVIFWKAALTSKLDTHTFFCGTAADKIIAVENNWLDRMRQTALYRYTFSEENFMAFEEAKTAGYFVSYKEIIPVCVEPVGDLIGKILSRNVELRFMPNLHPLKDQIVSSSLDFSIIRIRNAAEYNKV